ncbi:MAG: shikimate dehydrogenase [Bacteroidia bacterium]|nr:shikimate dehydrogenase [Bacteroidia bacterium]
MNKDFIQINGATEVLAIIADPVYQASTPGLANALLADEKLNQVLIPLHVKTLGLSDVINSLRHINNFVGAVVSMPHKTDIIKLLDELTPEAKQVGACNVIRRNRDGKLIGTMLDGEGFVKGLLDAGHLVKSKHIFLVGAGGAASGIAFAVAKHGADRLRIFNRTRDKADNLISNVKKVYPNLNIEYSDKISDEDQIIINGTSIGMKENNGLPISLSNVSESSVVAEVVITPELTTFLNEAKNKNCIIHKGKPMLEGQIRMMIDFINEVKN